LLAQSDGYDYAGARKYFGQREYGVFEEGEPIMIFSTARFRRKDKVASGVSATGSQVTRYGLVLVVGWLGAMKFTAYEVENIRAVVEGSPVLRWMYTKRNPRTSAAGLGVVELSIAGLIALRPWYPKASAVGSGLATMQFLTTLSTLFTTPGWEPSLGGFPAISGPVGQFLIKDFVLLGASIWSLGDSLKAARR
jgi:reactive chlorine resistance protein C